MRIAMTGQKQTGLRVGCGKVLAAELAARMVVFIHEVVGCDRSGIVVDGRLVLTIMHGIGLSK